jgi:hypothetical protein
MSGLVADDLSGFWQVFQKGARDATRGTGGAVCRGARALTCKAVELRRSTGIAGTRERHFRYLRDHYEADGTEDLIDRANHNPRGPTATAADI